jgi:selenoprotein W-related protein
LADAIITRFRGPIRSGHPVEAIELVPSGGGIFDVEADGHMVFSKHQVGRHAEHDEVIAALALLLPAT